MKVLVTGGSGFIGTAMTRKLLAEGHDVRVMDLWPSTVEGVESVVGSILDSSAVGNAVRGCDAVIHLAAMIGVLRTDSQPLECMDVNLQGAVVVLEECAKANVKKVVFSSSSEVYGDARVDMINENDPIMPKSIYAISKIAAEGYLRAYAERFGFDYGIVRFFNVYGIGQVAEFVLPLFVKAVMEGKSPKVFGDGDQIRCFCYMDDAAEGVYRVLTDEKANGEVFNIGNSHEPITMKRLAEKIIEISGKDIDIEFVALENSDRKPEREIFIRRPNISKAEKLLGYKPTVSLEEGIRRVIGNGQVNASPFAPTHFHK